MSESTIKVGIFDSGVGGLSLVNPLIESAEGVQLIYVADNAMVPYGNKSESIIRARCLEICEFFQRQGCDIIVFACNTATAIAVDQCREKIALPIVAMEPAVKPAATSSQSNAIAVCATQNTLKHPRFERLIEAYAKQTQVFRVACSEWVALVEIENLSLEHAHQVIARDLKPALEAGIDTVVLGCTHFPLLSAVIRKVVGEAVNIVNPAPAVVNKLLAEIALLRTARQTIKEGYSSIESSEKAGHVLYYTGESENYPAIINQYCQCFDMIKHQQNLID